MTVAANTGYRDADKATLEHLGQVKCEVIDEAGVACDACAAAPRVVRSGGMPYASSPKARSLMPPLITAYGSS